MNGLQFADEVLERIRQHEDRYDERAYLFWACRDFALRQFGLLAPEVLTFWGVKRTEDFGRIVFVLVITKVLAAEPGDREEDFAGIFDFAAAFGEPYRWEGVARM